MPVDVVVDVDDLIADRDVMVCTNFEFCQWRVTRMSRTSRYFEQLHRIGFIDRRRRNVERPRIDVPRVVLLRRVLEKLKLIATCAWGERLEFRSFRS